jgi:hypothetical protein
LTQLPGPAIGWRLAGKSPGWQKPRLAKAQAGKSPGWQMPRLADAGAAGRGVIRYCAVLDLLYD